MVRGLHRAGFHVAAAAGTRLAPGHWSRSVDERLHVPHPLTDEAVARLPAINAFLGQRTDEAAPFAETRARLIQLVS